MQCNVIFYGVKGLRRASAIRPLLPPLVLELSDRPIYREPDSSEIIRPRSAESAYYLISQLLLYARVICRSDLNADAVRIINKATA